MAHAGLPNYPVFDCQTKGQAIHWTKWITRLQNNVFVGYDVQDPKRQKALMLAYGGNELNDIYDTFDPAKLEPTGEMKLCFQRQCMRLYLTLTPNKMKNINDMSSDRRNSRQVS